MEYVVLRAARPTWLNTQLPTDVAELLRLAGPDGTPLAAAREIAFFARDGHVARVVGLPQGRDIVYAEQARQRSLGIAHVSSRALFNIPLAVQRHLALRSEARGPTAARTTDDAIAWFMPAPEYYEFRAYERARRRWSAPAGGGIAHVYLAKSVLPLAASLDELARRESSIEELEWRPMVEAMERAARPARAA